MEAKKDPDDVHNSDPCPKRIYIQWPTTEHAYVEWGCRRVILLHNNMYLRWSVDEKNRY